MITSYEHQGIKISRKSIDEKSSVPEESGKHQQKMINIKQKPLEEKTVMQINADYSKKPATKKRTHDEIKEEESKSFMTISSELQRIKRSRISNVEKSSKSRDSHTAKHRQKIINIKEEPIEKKMVNADYSKKPAPKKRTHDEIEEEEKNSLFESSFKSQKENEPKHKNVSCIFYGRLAWVINQSYPKYTSTYSQPY